MSREDARRFIERVESDSKFRALAMEASEHMLRLAREHGYDFTREDLHYEMKDRWGGTTDFWRPGPKVEFFCCLSKPPAF